MTRPVDAGERDRAAEEIAAMASDIDYITERLGAFGPYYDDEGAAGFLRPCYHVHARALDLSRDLQVLSGLLKSIPAGE